MARSPLRFRPGAEQSKNFDRDPEYGAQDYHNGFLLQVFTRSRSSARLILPLTRRTPAKAPATRSILLSSVTDGSCHESGVNSAPQTDDLVRISFSYTGVAARSVDNHRP